VHTRLSQTGAATAGSALPIQICKIFRPHRARPPDSRAFIADPVGRCSPRLLADRAAPARNSRKTPCSSKHFARPGHSRSHRAGSFWRGPLAQTAEHRRAAKAINFGIIYGLSLSVSRSNSAIDQKEAAKFIAATSRANPRQAYLDNCSKKSVARDLPPHCSAAAAPFPRSPRPSPTFAASPSAPPQYTLQGTAAISSSWHDRNPHHWRAKLPHSHDPASSR